MKDIIKFLNYEPGMVIITNKNGFDNRSNEIFVIFPTKNDLSVIQYGGILNKKYIDTNNYYINGYWESLNIFLNKNYEYIIKILDKPENGDLLSGKVLYSKKIEHLNKKEINIKEIAEKFGYDVNDFYITY